ncbi:MAG: DNA polymerase IV [Bacteroidota bacterium]
MDLRKILHIDMDAFYASIEQRDNPELRGKPVAVGGGGLRGVVASASYEARRYGVRSAMPSVVAARKCPNLIFVRTNFAVYRAASQQIRAIFHQYTDLVEPLSLDEAYLDVTEHPKAAFEIAEEIRQQIFETTQLTASAGVSFNKFLAKTASDINKPNGIKAISYEEAIPFLEKLPVEKFHGIGKVTSKKMHKMGLRTGADIKAWSELKLIRHFGKAGRHYYKIVRAKDERAVNPNRIRKSIGAERTYREDISDTKVMKEKLDYLAEVIFKHMTNNDNFGRTITLKIKTPEFKILTRSKSFTSEVRQLEQIRNIAHELLEVHRSEFQAVRLLGLSASNLEKEQIAAGTQLSFDF